MSVEEFVDVIAKMWIIFFSFMLFFVLIVTSPIWVFPYFIYKKTKAEEIENDERERE